MTARTVRLRRVLHPREDPNHPTLQVLSVYREHGVVPKASRKDNFNKTPEDLTRYLRVLPGDLVVNKMKAWSGSVAVSRYEGIVSGDYLVCAPSPSVDSQFLHHTLRSQALVSEMQIRSRGIRPSQERLYWDDLANIEVALPPLEAQRRTADFLDAQVARIDDVIAARSAQTTLLNEAEATSAFEILSAGDQQDRRLTSMGWLPSVPGSWPMATVHAGYSVQLGKMLDESKFTGSDAIPYLRNINVQWDRIATDDLKIMDISPAERERFTVRDGDLLICEGGQPGRSAVWDGSIAVLGYQKALHRARPRNDNDVRWLQLVLRVAVRQNVFAVEFGQATIGHLTGEQLCALRLPMPSPKVQRSRASAFAKAQSDLHDIATHLQRSIIKLEEFKRSLITAAVTGKFDVSSADGYQAPIA